MATNKKKSYQAVIPISVRGVKYLPGERIRGRLPVVSERFLLREGYVRECEAAEPAGETPGGGEKVVDEDGKLCG